METNKVLLHVCIITTENEELECFLPIILQEKMFIAKLQELIDNNVKAYYYNNNQIKVIISGKLIRILGVIPTKEKKIHQENNYNNTFSILDHVRSITSEETVKQLATAYGGMRIYIPKNPKKTHPLAQLLGLDNLQTIIKEIGDGYFVIPAKKYRCAGAKAQRILNLLKKNTSVREIAQIVDCCERTVWLHKSKSKAKISLD